MGHHVRRSTLAFCLIAASCGQAVPAHAQSWAESWFDNVTYTSPGSFEDQTRGYVTAGGMSGRVDVHDDYLMSLTLPKVKAGCGGIDMFLGGMSFLDYVTRHPIEPLGLRSTMFAEDFAAKSFTDRPQNAAGPKQHSKFKSEIAFINPVEPATGYRSVDGKLVPTDPKASANLFAFGSLWSSAEDISAWDIALAGGILVKNEANRALIYKPTKLANGTVVPAMAGWEFTRHPGFMEVKGSAPGFSAYLSRFTAAEDLVCVTLLANKEGLDLTVLARDIADSYKAGLGAGVASEGIVAQESKFPVNETISRLEARLRAQNVPVFAIFDHEANAQQVGMQLRPTKVLVFGNPKVGTRLMQDNQAIALDLPLRLSVWEDARGRVWVGYHALDRLAAEYGIKDGATVKAMAQALDALVAKAVNVYDY